MGVLISPSSLTALSELGSGLAEISEGNVADFGV